MEEKNRHKRKIVFCPKCGTATMEEKDEVYYCLKCKENYAKFEVIKNE